jgi:leucyl aminopeptidase (aminopeptidase T)
MTARTIELVRSANLIVHELLALKAGEHLAIVCDSHSVMEMVHAIAGESLTVGAEYTILQMPSRTVSRKNELTPLIELALEGADAMVGLTGSCGAPTYAACVKRLLDEKKLRSMSMVMRDVENFTSGGALADYKALRIEGEHLARIWAKGSVMHITSPAGTDICAPIEAQDVIVECGYADRPGLEAGFSDGEVSSRPVEGTAEGIIVVDGPIAQIGRPETPIRLTVEKGLVTRVEGASPQAIQLREIIETLENARNIAEFGIGLNPACRRNGQFQEEKKARGLVHIAIGDNIFYGGTVTCAVHMDMVQYAPTVMLDDLCLVRDGRVLDSAVR